jgi:transcriptional regulator with XRE-family HTH domain
MTRLGRNIERLRKECGWSFDELASKTGLDKKLVLSRVNRGTKPVPRNLKLYAQAFSKAIGQTISVSDLEN